MNKRQAVLITACLSTGLSALVWIAVAVLFFARSSATDNTSTHPASQPDSSLAAVRNDQQTAQLAASTANPTTTPAANPTDRSLDLLLDEKFPYLELPDGVLSSAFDSVTSEILLVGAHKKQLAIYRAEQIGQRNTPAALIPLPGRPTAVGVKLLDDQRLYVVATIEPTLLVMIDADSRKIVRQVSLTLPQLKIWDNLNKDDPGMMMAPFRKNDLDAYNSYGRFNRLNYEGSSNAFQYDLRTMKEGPPLQGKIVSVAPEGPKKKTLFMPLNRGENDLHLAELTSDNKLNVQSTQRPWQSKIFPRLIGDLVVMGQRVTTLDLNEELGIAEFYPKAQMPNTDLIAGNYGRTVRIASLSPLESVFEFDLPKEWVIREDPTDSSSELRETEVFADTHAMQFIFVLPNRLVTIPLSIAGIEPQPSLQLALDGATTVFAGHNLELNVIGRPKIHQILLAIAPDGMTLENNKLTWTPSNEQTGSHTCTLRHSDGERVVERSWKITVRRSGFNLPFGVRGGDIAPDGRLGVFSGFNPNREDAEWRSALAFVDMEELRILKLVKFSDDASVRCGDRLILTSTAKGLTLYDRETLETIPTPPNLRLGMLSNLTLGDVQNLETILLEKPAAEQVADQNLKLPDQLDGPTGFGYFDNGVLRDASTGHPLLLDSSGWLVRPGQNRRLKTSFVPTPGIWHPYRIPSTILRTSRSFGIVGQHWSSPDRFAVKMVDKKLVLHIFALNSQEPLGVALLSETGFLHGTTGRKLLDPPGETRSYAPTQTRLFPGPNRVSVTYKSRLFVVQRSELPTPDPPFHIVPLQSVFELPATGSVDVKYEADGALEFQLTIKNQPDITSNDGRFQLNMTEITPKLIEAYIGKARFVFRNQDRHQYLQKAFVLSREGYKDVFGKETTDVPLRLQIQLVAQNERQKKAYLGHDYVVLVPEETVINALEQNKK